MNGLRAVLYECLGIQSDRTLIKEEFNYLSWNEDDDGQTIGQKIKNLFSSSEFNANKSVNISEPVGIKGMVLQLVWPMILAGLECWKDLPIFLAWDYLF